MPSYNKDEEHEEHRGRARRRLPFDVTFRDALWASVRLIIFFTFMAFMWGVGVRMIVEVFNFGWELIHW